jgi:hypothetical protein
MVVTLLPPPPPSATDAAASSGTSSNVLGGTTQDENTQTALFYRPGDLKPQLRIPLGATVPAKAPTPDTLNASEAKQIDSLTQGNKFVWSIQPNSGLLVLDRP